MEHLEEAVCHYSGKAARIFVIYLLWRRVQRFFGWNSSLRDILGSVILQIPAVRKQYLAQALETLPQRRAALLKAWKPFGEPLTAIPENGWSLRTVQAVVDKWSAITNNPLKEKLFSGCIYPNMLMEDQQLETVDSDPGQYPRSLVTDEDYAVLSRELQEAFSYSFKRAYLWNELHSNEFGIGYFLTYQVVRMVADMFGGEKDDVMGFVTSGGTESLMAACRMYRNFGQQEKGHLPGESVIVACDTIHAAVLKGGAAYNIKVVQSKFHTPDRRIDLVDLRRLLDKHGSKVVAIFASAPSFATGVIDPIAELAVLARQYKVGLHVDSCLGGFIVNNLHHDTNFLSIPGVTSLSADTHKNGWAPKGSSVVVTRSLRSHLYGDVNSAFYSAYAFPGWNGGVYGTPRDPGSLAVVPTLHAFIALVMIGKSGYRTIARAIHDTCVGMSEVIKERFELELCAPPEANVFAWRISPNVNWPSGAIYAFAHEMDHHGFNINAMRDELVHMCVTGRTAVKERVVERFANAVDQSLAAVKLLERDVREGRKAFPGDAGLYGMLSEAIEPSAKKGWADFIEKWLFGRRGAEDAVKAYFIAHNNPYSQTNGFT